MSTPSPKYQNHYPRWAIYPLAIGVLYTLAWQLSVPLLSTDLWWHISLGRHILESGSLVIDHSIFSWTPADPNNTYNAWFGQVVLYLIDRFSGSTGLLAFRFLVYFGVVFLAWHYSQLNKVQHNPLTWIATLLCLTMMWGAFEVKTELFTQLFFTIAVWLYYLIRTLGEKAYRLPYLFPLLLIVWINTHGGFFVTSLFFGATIIGELINYKYAPNTAMPPKLRKHYFIAMCLCFPALLVNPFGYHLPLDIIDSVLNMRAVGMKHIIAYIPTYNFNDGPLYLLDNLIAAMILFVFLLWQYLKNREMDWVVALSFIVYCALYIQIARVTYFLGPIFLFACLDMLKKRDRSWAWPSSTLKRSLLIATSFFLIGGISVRSIAYFGCDGHSLPQRMSDSTELFRYNASEEADFIADNITGPKIGNTVGDGGYLIYRFWPEKKVLIDTRNFPYRSWFDEYMQFMSDKNKYGSFIGAHPADFWLIRFTRPNLFRWFTTSDDWSLAFLGPSAGVFVPRTNPIGNKTTISPKIAELNTMAPISNALASTLEIEDQAFVKQLQVAANTNFDLSCGDNHTFVQELDNVIRGMSFFYKQEYEKAAEYLEKPGKFIHSQRKAANSYLLLANKAWEEENYKSARDFAIKAFKATKTQTSMDFFNLLLAEWQYQNFSRTSMTDEKNESAILKLADIILKNTASLPKEWRHFAVVATEIKENRYDGRARLFIP